ncbi:MAG TPA: glycosyltransferase family 4 protein [Thermoanaerobaculia bacterium]
MLIQAFLPDIHRRPTGGNLFNRRVLAYLDGVARVERRVVADGEPLPEPRGDVALIDSLLLAAAAGASRGGAGTRLLLAHYLRLFEPGLRDSDQARRERRLLARLDGVITTSRYCRDALVAEGLSPRRVGAVTPGLPASFFADVAARPPGTPRLLTVATVLEGKGLRSLLGVLETLAELDWTWELAGDPDLDPGFSARFRRRLAASPVAGRVRLLGAVDPERMAEVYDRADVFVLPSRFETCSIATMEAMARGLPVVAYRVGGIPERVPAATAELLAPPGDGERLGAVLRRLLTDRDEAAALGIENRRASRAFPTWEACGAAVWELVRQLRDGAG